MLIYKTASMNNYNMLKINKKEMERTYKQETWKYWN